jgi:hypothetical protein
MTEPVAWELSEFRKDQELSKLLETTQGDIFRWLHYHGGDSCHFSVDVDLTWVDAEPEPHISAFIEHKNVNETVSFPQAVLFEAVSKIAPVYIIRSRSDLLDVHPSKHSFDIERVVGLDRTENGSWTETELVESSLKWGREINGQGDLDPDYHSGLLGFEENHRRKTQNLGGNGHAAADPGDITAYTYDD